MWVLIVVISYFSTPPAASPGPVVAFQEFNTKESCDAAAASFAGLQEDIAKLKKSMQDSEQVGNITGFFGAQATIRCLAK